MSTPAWSSITVARPRFQTPAALVIDQEQHHAVVPGKVADRDVLPVARIIGKGERAVVEHLEEARRPAPVLHVRPAVGARRANEEVVDRSDEGDQIVWFI